MTEPGSSPRAAARAHYLAAAAGDAALRAPDPEQPSLTERVQRLHEAGVVPVAGADKPHPHGLKAVDPAGAAGASARCVRAGALAAEAAAAADTAQRERRCRLRRMFERAVAGQSVRRPPLSLLQSAGCGNPPCRAGARSL
jgi:hypothetical protein